MGSPTAPRSPTLLPPRKSVELEDPGAHELSETDEDHFSDAQEGQGPQSMPSSPVPTTRVEKIDDRESHGEVPGTAAYKMRTQDAVPDELEVIPDGARSRSASQSQQIHQDRPSGSVSGPIPRTVVDKVDPASPSHGDVPGTAAHSKRKADAIPDVIRPATASETQVDGLADRHIASDINVPSTVITKIDSEPSHGEIPGTEAFEMRKSDAKPDNVVKVSDGRGLPSRTRPGNWQRIKSSAPPDSVIAADGGFGPMISDESAEEDEPGHTDERVISERGEAEEDEIVHDEPPKAEFDDFEAGSDDEDFGDFDEGVQAEEEEERGETSVHIINSAPPVESRWPILDFTTLDTLDDINRAISPYLDEILPTSKTDPPTAPNAYSNPDSMFLTDRSLSLWSQLVEPPPLQPPNWVRSRIRRLFLVSLGVPVDLDEILPASKQKKLILPSTRGRSGSQSPPEGRRTGSRARLKQDNESTTSLDRQSSSKTSRKKKGIPSLPEFDLPAAKLLGDTTEVALSNMTDEELQAHVDALQRMTLQASEVLEYWLKQRDSALGDKEAFEGVIENLVKHARRVRH